MNVTVIGLGAMGGGMARSLLRSDSIQSVTGYDLNVDLCSSFYQEALKCHKTYSSIRDNLIAHPNLDSSCKKIHLSDCIHKDTHVVVLVLVNEEQCQETCFGSQTHMDDGTQKTTKTTSLIQLLSSNSTVILCSTVSSQWAIAAAKQFERAQIQFVDCPISGGPVRALKGDLTLMASGTNQALDHVQPILLAMGGQQQGNANANIHYLGQVGNGSTVKMIHQLLAGVHIVAAAEALTLAAKAGIDPVTMYNIVKGAAGNSWMFADRGKSMIRRVLDDDDDDDDDGNDNHDDIITNHTNNNHTNKESRVMSSLAIFIKDLSIVHSEAKHHQSPIPLASVALQQFISGASLGLCKEDDSSVVQVYETLAQCKVMSKNDIVVIDAPPTIPPPKQEGMNVGEYWTLEDGIQEEIVEVGMEPRHQPVLMNEFTRVLRVSFPPNDSTLAHRHAEDSLYFFLVESGLNVINHVQGFDPKCDCMEYGEVRYGTHKSDPLVHKITNKSDTTMLCIDAEILSPPPVSCPFPLVAECHTLIKTRDKVRVYRMSLEPGQIVTVSYPFYHLTVVLSKGNNNKKKNPSSASVDTTTDEHNRIKTTIGDGVHGLSWTNTVGIGHVEWHSPRWNVTLENVGVSLYEHYVVEWM